MFTFNNDTVKNALAIFVPLSFIVHLAMWIFFPPEMLSDKVIGMLQSMLGLHGAWAGMIINFYFSSSASSARKDEIIAASAPIVPIPVAVPIPSDPKVTP